MKLKPQDAANIIIDPYQYLARDEDNQWYAYIEEPKPGDDQWINGAECEPINIKIDYDGDWKDSLFVKHQVKDIKDMWKDSLFVKQDSTDVRNMKCNYTMKEDIMLNACHIEIPRILERLQKLEEVQELTKFEIDIKNRVEKLEKQNNLLVNYLHEIDFPNPDDIFERINKLEEIIDLLSCEKETNEEFDRSLYTAEVRSLKEKIEELEKQLQEMQSKLWMTNPLIWPTPTPSQPIPTIMTTTDSTSAPEPIKKGSELCIHEFVIEKSCQKCGHQWKI